MKAYVIVGILILGATVVFVWFVRMTRPDRKKLKIVHLSEDEKQVA